jgi:hypothetical protein
MVIAGGSVSDIDEENMVWFLVPRTLDKVV